MTVRTKKEKQLFNEIISAMLQNPRASLNELAQEINLSKATLYRFGGSRENLETMVLEYTTDCINELLDKIKLDPNNPIESLNNLMEACVEKDAVINLLMTRWYAKIEIIKQTEYLWNQALDSFFLEGQKRSVFCLDINAAALTEAWIALLVGLIDANHRGRVAKTDLVNIQKKAFFEGVLVN